jgi:hypothetical protein
LLILKVQMLLEAAIEQHRKAREELQAARLRQMEEDKAAKRARAKGIKAKGH